jgi:hypothetical protein
MPGSCCGGSPKPALVKVMPATEAAVQKPAAKSNKSECCNDKPAKSEKHGCGC